MLPGNSIKSVQEAEPPACAGGLATADPRDASSVLSVPPGGFVMPLGQW